MNVQRLYGSHVFFGLSGDCIVEYTISKMLDQSRILQAPTISIVEYTHSTRMLQDIETSLCVSHMTQVY